MEALTVVKSEPLPVLSVTKSAPLPEEQAGFWGSLGAQINPIPALKEWINRPSEVRSSMDALHVLNRIHEEAAKDPANKGQPIGKWKLREPTADEQSVIDKGMNAHLPGAEENIATQTAQPAFTAGHQAATGDVPGALGTLAGGYVAPVVAGEAASRAPAAVRAVATLPAKVAEVAKKPGVLTMTKGAAEVAGGTVAMASHPIEGGIAIGAGARDILKGVAERRAARQAAMEARKPLEIVKSEPLPAEAVPAQIEQPQAETAQATAAPQPTAEPVQAQSAPAPTVEPFDPASLPPDSYKETATFRQGEIAKLERRKFLAPREKELLAQLKAEASPATAEQPAPDATQTPTIHAIPATETVGPEVHKAQARTTRAANIEALAKEMQDVDPDQLPLILKNPSAAAKLRDLAKSVNVELPKDLRKTVGALQERLVQLRKAKPKAAASVITPSAEYGKILSFRPAALTAAQKLAEAFQETNP